MAVYVSKSDIDALVKDLKKISTDNDTVKKNIESAIKEIEKQSYDAKADQLAKLKDIKKKLDAQVSSVNEMVKIFQDTQTGFFSIDNSFKKKAANIAATVGTIIPIVGFAATNTWTVSPSISLGDETVKGTPVTETVPAVSAEGEIGNIITRAKAGQLTFNYVQRDSNGKSIQGWEGGTPIYGTDKNGKAIGTISCVSFANNKLYERGLINTPQKGLITGLDDSYKKWAAGTTVPNNMADATIAMLKSELSANGGKPINNIYVSTGGNKHTSLIDTAFLDGNGNLRFVLSENQNGSNSNLLYTAEGHPFRQFMETKEVSEAELRSMWKYNTAPTTFKIFG